MAPSKMSPPRIKREIFIPEVKARAESKLQARTVQYGEASLTGKPYLATNIDMAKLNDT